MTNDTTTPGAGAGLTWDTAPAGVQLWGVYGSDCFPTVFACKLLDYPDCGRAVWGWSVYRRKGGFRTLGTGRAWADEHSLRLFASRAAAFSAIAQMFPDEDTVPRATASETPDTSPRESAATTPANTTVGHKRPSLAAGEEKTPDAVTPGVPPT